MTEERINVYCKEYINWLSQRREIGNKLFVPNNLNLFYLVSSIVNSKLKEYEFKEKVQADNVTFSKIDFFDKIEIVKNFFKDINMNVDVERCLSDGTIEPFLTNFNINDVKKYMQGHGQADENGNGDVIFPNSGLALDIVIMMHELAHFPHKLTIDCNKELSIISEAVALYTELQSYDYMDELGYNNEASFFKNYRLKTVYEDSKRYANSISLLLTYITFESVSKENFNKLFVDKDYYETINGIKNSDDFYSIESGMNYVFGILLATYMYEMVKKDFSFTENINILNKNLNNSSFKNSLEMLGISSFDKGLIIKLSSSMDEYNNANGSVKK